MTRPPHDRGGLHRRQRLSLAWQRRAKGILWRIVPDDDQGLIGEDRDPASRTVTFFRLRISSGAPVWEDVAPRGGWWTGIECVTGRAVLLHGFASPDLPGHRGLIALDLDSGRELWADDDAVFMAVVDGVAFALRAHADRRELIGRDLVTGELTGTEPADEGRLRELLRRWRSSAVPMGAVPGPVADGAESDDVVRVLPSGARGAGAGVEAIRVGGVVIAAHHERAAAERQERPAYSRILSVMFDDSPTPAFRDILDENLPAPMPDAFLIINRTLLYVKERRTLCAMHLPGAAGRG